MGSQTGEEEEEEEKGEEEGESKGEIVGGRKSWTCSQERLSGDLGYSESHEFPQVNSWHLLLSSQCHNFCPRPDEALNLTKV